jgi:hypothetical protein
LLHRSKKFIPDIKKHFMGWKHKSLTLRKRR